MIRIAIIEGQEIVRAGLVNTISQLVFPAIELCGHVADSDQGIQLIAKTLPDIVILNIDLPGMGGIELTNTIKQKFIKSKVILIGTIVDPEVVALALNSGADSYLLLNSSLETLRHAVLETYQNGCWIDSRISKISLTNKSYKIKNNFSKGRKLGISLTKTEISTLRLMARGLSNEQIAKIQNVSLGTVKSCAYVINQKLSVENRVQAIIRGILLGYLNYNSIIIEAACNEPIQSLMHSC